MADEQLTTTSYIILALLSSRDWSAYELAEQVGRGVDQIWARADRQRYNVPKKLARLGLIEGRREPGPAGRPRTVYSITDAGAAALREWMATDVRPATMEFEGLIKVLTADQGSVDDLRRTLVQIRDQAIASRDLFVAHAGYIVETGGTFPEREHLFALVNRYMVGQFAHTASWAEWALAECESWTRTDDPGSHHERSSEILGESARSADSP